MDRRSTTQTSLQVPNGHPSPSSSDPKFSISNWSVNFLNVARDRFSSLATSISTSLDSQSIGSHRRRGSWSPAEAAAYYYQAQQRKVGQNRAGGAEVVPTATKGLYIYSIENDFSNGKTSNGLATRGHLSRRSTQSLRTLRTSDLPPTFAIPISVSSVQNSKINNPNAYQTTSFTVHSNGKCGSLESVDFDEEELLDDSSSTSSDSEPHRFGSSGSSFGSSPISSSFVRSTSGFISDYEHSSSSSSGHNRSDTSSTRLDESYARAFGYHSLDEIELYHELHKMFLSRKLASVSAIDANSTSGGGESNGRRGCSKSVIRFGLGYEDNCLFPLVLPVFLSESLQKKSNSYVTWDYIKLQADAELCRWEYASLQNLSRRFATPPITGPPIENICPDPNLFLRNLCYQLVIEDNFRAMYSREKNRALKRWNSTNDLLSMPGGSGNKGRKLEPEFIGARTSNPKKSFTDESFSLARTWTVDPRASFRKKPDSGRTSPAAKKPIFSNNLLFKEMTTLVGQNHPVQLALYLTKYYLEQMQNGFDVQMLAQLVLVKDIASLDRSKVNRKLRQTLLNLLTFDDTLVSVIGDHFRRQTTVEAQARALSSIIETGCLLRQLRNFYGLNVLVGALQSLPVYSMTDAWRHLHYHMHVHYSDFKRLCKLTRKLNHSILGTNKPHIPTLANLLNRLRLCCAVSWDLFEAKRRFVEHPSIAGWLHTEALGHPRPRGLTDFKVSDFDSNSSTNAAPLLARLNYDPIAESYLPTHDPIRLIHWQEFPANWSGRYLPAIPERYLRNLLQTKSFTSMVECFFRQPLDRYLVANV